jgi:hypothetical protein
MNKKQLIGSELFLKNKSDPIPDKGSYKDSLFMLKIRETTRKTILNFLLDLAAFYVY